MATPSRCGWASSDPLYVRYHDEEWGVPVHDDRRLFEMLILEGAQAGLSWITILRKRGAYRKAFDRFDPRRVATYDARKRRALLADAGIVRNRAEDRRGHRQRARVPRGAERVRQLRRVRLAFCGRPAQGEPPAYSGDVPARTAESDAISKDLKLRGFRFVGSTICYAFMQAVGLVDDHVTTCFRKRGRQAQA